MTNKSMLSVERKLLEIVTDNRYINKESISIRRWEALCKLRSILSKPAARQQGEPVAWQFYQDGKWWNGDDRIKDHRKNTENSGYKTRELYAEQPEPAADHTQCEECKGWGYHENHHDGGGTECGECGGSGNATVAVAVVMPDVDELAQIIRKVDSSHTLGAGSLAEAILEEVARLNGVKP